MIRFIDASKNLVEAARNAAELAGEATPHIDERFLAIGRRVIAQSDNPFFKIIDEKILEESRPDSVNHRLTLLQPNALTTEDLEDKLGLVDIMLGDQAPELTEAFGNYADKHRLFERIGSTPEKPGEKFLVVSNHLELPDQGFTLGLWQKAGRERGFDKLESHLTVVVGRLIGYYQLGDANVVDDILRKAGSVLKTFPSGGTEAMTEDEIALSIFRKISNHRTKEVFNDLLDAHNGRIICMAPSGEQDRYDPQNNVVRMRRFGAGTSEMMIDASEKGATIIPIFVDYSDGSNIVKLLDPVEPGSVRTREDCDKIGNTIAHHGTFARGEEHSKHPDIKRFGAGIVYETP